MSSLFDILAAGTPVSDFTAKLTELEVEENLDLPSAFRLTLPITVTGSCGTWRTFAGGGPSAW